MMRAIRLDSPGKIRAGREAGRYVRVVDDAKNTGGS
jgi:hypothetical protein